jgi:hypothetical protein
LPLPRFWKPSGLYLPALSSAPCFHFQGERYTLWVLHSLTESFNFAFHPLTMKFTSYNLLVLCEKISLKI